jgi:murein DD-endopeptidase MepM/ murein hydrolase activator NlpD
MPVRGSLGLAAMLGIAMFVGCAATTAPPEPVFLEPRPAEPLVLAGSFRVDDALAARWGLSGAWRLPVGNPYELGAPDPDGAPGYRVNRGVSAAPRRHDGADLSNQHGGGMVRAAADGLVVRVAGSGGGYGAHVVLAHRLPDGSLVYSVYGHLRPRSFAVAAGELVAAGQVLGRVGRTGRASSAHLHFEIRRADAPTAQWQLAGPVDPIAFVVARLPAARSDSTWVAPYIMWAETAALVPDSTALETPLTRADWWTILAGAARRGPDHLPADPNTLHDALAAAGVVPDVPHGGAGDPIPWSEAARDLERLSEIGLRIPRCPVDPPAHEAALDGRPRWSPTDPPDGVPTLADALLALADVSLQRARAGR